MSRKIIILLLLFNYLNTCIFLPETVLISLCVSDISPSDKYDEINSLIEFIIDNCMGRNDQTPEDEDDDIPDSSKIGEKEGIEDHICNVLVFSLQSYADCANTKRFVKNDNKLYFVFLPLYYSPPELV